MMDYKAVGVQRHLTNYIQVYMIDTCCVVAPHSIRVGVPPPGAIL